MLGRITKLEGSDQQRQQTNQEEDVDEVPGVTENWCRMAPGDCVCHSILLISRS